MSNQFQALDGELTQALEAQLAPRLKRILLGRSAGRPLKGD